MFGNLRTPSAFLLAAALLAGATRLPGQARSEPLPAWSLALAPPAAAPPGITGVARSARPIRWYHGVGALAAVGLASLADERIREEVQANRTDGKDDVASVMRRMGEPEVYLVPSLGTLAVGLVTGEDRITRAGGRITAGLVTAGVVTHLLKAAVGRRRPSGTTDAFEFKPFDRWNSWPSGHATMAFALATGVADEVRRTPVTILLYGAATLNAWSRVNDNRHWVSDVLAGALVGVTSAKLMNGRWRVFGISAPRFLLEPGAAGLGLTF